MILRFPQVKYNFILVDFDFGHGIGLSREKSLFSSFRDSSFVKIDKVKIQIKNYFKFRVKPRLESN